jgi:alginate O-acetyltransferase complex protein AlgJ
MHRIRIRRTNSLLFTTLVFATGLISLQAIELPEAKLPQVIDGQAFRRAENLYEDNLPGKNWITGGWALLNYRLFHSGNDGVVIGRDDWLFSAEEYRLDSNWQHILQSNLETIGQVGKRLAAKDITLVVALVPEKADLYRAQTDWPSPHLDIELYQRSLRALQDQGLAVVDLRTPLAAAVDRGEQVFFRTDTHWKVHGAEVAARAIAHSGLLPTGATRFKVEPDKWTAHWGDLTRFVPVGKAFADYGPGVETLHPMRFTRQATAEALFDEAPLDIALVGTSYSANKNWQFLQWLQRAMGKEVVNHAVAAKGPMAPMLDFLDHKGNEEPGLTHVIWEVPVRYLIMPPDFYKHT